MHYESCILHFVFCGVLKPLFYCFLKHLGRKFFLKNNVYLVRMSVYTYIRQHQSHAGGQGQYGSWAGAVTKICSPFSSKCPKTRSDYRPTKQLTNSFSTSSKVQFDSTFFSLVALLESHSKKKQIIDKGRL